ncbi:hypothetical protein BS78_06G123500 [Paspalum vaginatum]|nr:hypothetical protein BS78_06G123500 [Paspalum vaginatum]KAJ1271369.1 hypothetical protein BS78_06G123500 [Paspalum vaginatum]KAJ1271370.1 hypothetical protein BS78_06G123500 [Paspalum vaginatum]
MRARKKTTRARGKRMRGYRRRIRSPWWPVATEDAGLSPPNPFVVFHGQDPPPWPGSGFHGADLARGATGGGHGRTGGEESGRQEDAGQPPADPLTMASGPAHRILRLIRSTDPAPHRVPDQRRARCRGRSGAEAGAGGGDEAARPPGPFSARSACIEHSHPNCRIVQ